MNETMTCAWDGCFENIEHVCEVCKRSFCVKHAKQGQFNTDTGKLQYATLCITHQEVGLSGARDTSDTGRIMKQIGIFVVLILVVILLISLIIGAVTD